jgi:hypothetical protein
VCWCFAQLSESVPGKISNSQCFLMIASALQYIYYTALQRQQERLLARRLTRQQRHLHYMHHHGSDSDSSLPVTSVGGRPSDEVS